MSQTEFFPQSTTTLRKPSWLGSKMHEDHELPLAPGDRWTVACLKTNATIYSGIGPVEILRERLAA